MDTTPVSLLERLKQPAAADAWERLVELYTPLLYYWARRMGLQRHDAADLAQEVFAVLVQKLPEFNYDRHRSFRGWLRTVTVNKWRDRQRRRRLPTAGPDDPEVTDVAARDECADFWEAEYRQHLVGRALQLMQAEFQPSTWKACWELVVNGRPAVEVGRELGLNVGAVYAAKFRVLSRLRQELCGLMD